MVYFVFLLGRSSLFHPNALFAGAKLAKNVALLVPWNSKQLPHSALSAHHHFRLIYFSPWNSIPKTSPLEMCELLALLHCCTARKSHSSPFLSSIFYSPLLHPPFAFVSSTCCSFRSTSIAILRTHLIQSTALNILLGAVAMDSDRFFFHYTELKCEYEKIDRGAITLEVGRTIDLFLQHLFSNSLKVCMAVWPRLFQLISGIHLAEENLLALPVCAWRRPSASWRIMSSELLTF